MSKAYLGKGSTGVYHSPMEEGELLLSLRTIGGKTYKKAVIFFSKTPNGTSGHSNCKMGRAIRCHDSKQEKLILANLDRKGICWKAVD